MRANERCFHSFQRRGQVFLGSWLFFLQLTVEETVLQGHRESFQEEFSFPKQKEKGEEEEEDGGKRERKRDKVKQTKNPSLEK